MSEEKDEPKLIIDDDWKEQVQREKEQLEAKDAAAPETTEDSDSEPSDDSVPPPPPVSLEMLVAMLASQALMSMGQIPDPATGKPESNKAYAKHYIDTISMLEEKTKGNLTSEEETAITQTLHQLRMVFISS